MPLVLTTDLQQGALRWARDQLALTSLDWPAGSSALSVIETDPVATRAVVVAVNTYDGVVDAHFATDHSKRWASRNVLRGIFGYLFLVCKTHRVQCLVSTDNTAMIDINARLGFAIEGVAREGFDRGKDGVIMGMTRAMCPWLDPQDKGL